MKKHTKIYIDYFGWDSFFPCEICGCKGVDIHHIEARGMGGGRGNDVIENLMLLCRKCHEKYGDKKEFKDWLMNVHRLHMEKVKK